MVSKRYRRSGAAMGRGNLRESIPTSYLLVTIRAPGRGVAVMVWWWLLMYVL